MDLLTEYVTSFLGDVEGVGIEGIGFGGEVVCGFDVSTRFNGGFVEQVTFKGVVFGFGWVFFHEAFYEWVVAIELGGDSFHCFDAGLEDATLLELTFSPVLEAVVCVEDVATVDEDVVVVFVETSSAYEVNISGT